MQQQLNGWEYGIAIGVIAVIVPAFMGVVVWMVKRAMSDSKEATKNALDAMVLSAKQATDATRVQFEELKGIELRMNQAVLDGLRERDRSCTEDHAKLVEEIHRLNTHLSELTGMLTFILEHYIQPNGKSSGGKT